LGGRDRHFMAGVVSDHARDRPQDSRSIRPLALEGTPRGHTPRARVLMAKKNVPVLVTLISGHATKSPRLVGHCERVTRYSTPAFCFTKTHQSGTQGWTAEVWMPLAIPSLARHRDYQKLSDSAPAGRESSAPPFAPRGRKHVRGAKHLCANLGERRGRDLRSQFRARRP